MTLAYNPNWKDEEDTSSLSIIQREQLLKFNLLRGYRNERDLRARYPSLKDAWEKYQTVLTLVLYEVNDESK